MKIHFSNFYDISGWPTGLENYFIANPLSELTPDLFEKKGMPGMTWLSWCNLILAIDDFRKALTHLEKISVPEDLCKLIKSSGEAEYIFELDKTGLPENAEEILLRFRGSVIETMNRGHFVHSPVSGFPEKAVISNSLPNRYLGFMKRSGYERIEILIPPEVRSAWHNSTHFRFPEEHILTDVRSKIDRLVSISRLENAFSNWLSFLRVHIKSGTSVSLYHSDNNKGAVIAVSDESNNLLDSYRFEKSVSPEKIISLFRRFSSKGNPLILPLSSTTELVLSLAKQLPHETVLISDAAIRTCGENIGIEKKITSTHPHILRALALAERARIPLDSARRTHPADLGLFEYISGPEIAHLDFMFSVLLKMPVDNNINSAQTSISRVILNPLIKSLNDLKPGMSVSGTVTSITTFGAFIRITNELEGLLHISEMSDERVTDIHSLMKTGDTITVSILSTEADSGRISLTRRSPGRSKSHSIKQKNIESLEKLFRK